MGSGYKRLTRLIMGLGCLPSFIGDYVENFASNSYKTSLKQKGNKITEAAA